MNATLPDKFRFNEEGLFRESMHLSNFMVLPKTVYHRHGETIPFACDLEIRTTGQVMSFDRIPFKELTEEWWKNPPPGCWYDSQKRRPDKDVQILFQAGISSALSVEVI